MADVIGQRIAGNLVYINRAAHLKRLVGAIGPDVLEFFDDFVRSSSDSSDTLVGATVTLVEAGGGETTVAFADVAGGELLITTDAAENDGANIQWAPEAFKLTGHHYFYFGCRVKISNATESDLFVGLAVTDTDILGGVTDSIGFRKVDGATTLSVVVEKNSTETTATAAADIGTSHRILELVHEGSVLEGFVDGVSIGTIATTNLPDDEELRPSIHFLTGSANARTCSVDWIRIVQIGGRA